MSEGVPCAFACSSTRPTCSSVPNLGAEKAIIGRSAPVPVKARRGFSHQRPHQITFAPRIVKIDIEGWEVRTQSETNAGAACLGGINSPSFGTRTRQLGAAPHFEDG